MRVKPISEEKANEGGNFKPWPAGDYDFTVSDASEELSKKGNEMIKLTLHVFNRDGNKRTVFDYLLASEDAQWKVRHFAEAVGLVRQYESGELDVNDIFEKSGELTLRMKPAQGDYPAGNQVGDYIPRTGAVVEEKAPARSSASRAKVPAGDIDDDIPF